MPELSASDIVARLSGIMFPLTGRKLRGDSDKFGTPPRSYAEVVSVALRAQLGDSRRAVKTVQRWTGASERSVKNWFAASTGPAGRHLLSLLTHSDTVLEMLLVATRRLELLDRFLERDAGSVLEGVRGGALRSVPENDLDRDPGYDPDDGFEPNERQRWFLAELASGRRETASSVQRHFGVCEKTAKRDLACLKVAGRVEFVGSRRRGRYRLVM